MKKNDVIFAPLVLQARKSHPGFSDSFCDLLKTMDSLLKVTGHLYLFTSKCECRQPAVGLEEVL